MSNENFILQMGNLNTAAGISKGEDYRLDQTVGQTAPGLYSGANYKELAPAISLFQADLPMAIQ
ncbi:MAG: hypothetical protein HYW64_00215 [Candidatus Levybacteria bacterium]|nr:hypothetical protein [Candidatus Levybacteria bacterium]